MYLIKLLLNSVQSQDLWILDKLHWDWVQTDLTWSLLGESVTPWQVNLRLVLAQLRTHVAMPEIDYFVTSCSVSCCLEQRCHFPLLHLILLLSRFCESSEKSGDIFESWMMIVVKRTSLIFFLWISSRIKHYDFDIHCSF